MLEDNGFPLHVGVTGTRHGASDAQLYEFTGLVYDLNVGFFHHGCCVGADTQAAAICRKFIGAHIIGHPPIDKHLMSDFVSDDSRPPLGYLERNRAIVRESHAIIAMPAEQSEQSRGGTWSTFRYAKKMNRRVYLILPDGTTKLYFEGRIQSVKVSGFNG